MRNQALRTGQEIIAVAREENRDAGRTESSHVNLRGARGARFRGSVGLCNLPGSVRSIGDARTFLYSGSSTA
jgi:hypothetical protein